MTFPPDDGLAPDGAPLRPSWPGCDCQADHTLRDYVEAVFRALMSQAAEMQPGQFPDDGYTTASRMAALYAALHHQERPAVALPTNLGPLYDRALDGAVRYIAAHDETGGFLYRHPALAAAIAVKDNMSKLDDADSPESAQRVLFTRGLMETIIDDIASIYKMKRICRFSGPTAD